MKEGYFILIYLRIKNLRKKKKKRIVRNIKLQIVIIKIVIFRVNKITQILTYIIIYECSGCKYKNKLIYPIKFLTF